MEISTVERTSKILSEDSIVSAVNQVETNGYVIFENVIERDEIRKLYHAFNEIFKPFVESNKDVVKFGNCRMDLPCDEPFIGSDVITNPFAMPIIDRILGDDCTCQYFASNTSMPSTQYQSVHSDLFPLFPNHEISLPSTALVLNIPLVDFTMENGPLEIWPGGTHRIPDSDNRPQLIQSTASQIEPKQVLMPAGSVLIRDIRMWHRGTPNRTQVPRPMIALVYFRHWFYSTPSLRIQKSTYLGLSEKGKRLFRKEQIV